MPLAQIQACLAAIDRRDAALALLAMQGVHAAQAPLAVGKEGSSIFEKFVGAMKRVISPKRYSENESQADNNIFKMLKAKAEADQAALSKNKARLRLKPNASNG